MTLLFSITPDTTTNAGARRSLVLALDESWAVVDAQIAAYWPQCRRTGTELVVVCTLSSQQLLLAQSRYPGVHLVGAAIGQPLRTLRHLGIQAASGDIVSLIDSRQADARLAAASPRRRAASDDLRLDTLS
jgi:hypothetical protein